MKKILFIVPQVVYPATDGGKQAIYQRLQRISEIYETYIVMVNVENKKVDLDLMRKKFPHAKKIYVLKRLVRVVNGSSLLGKISEGIKWLISGKDSGSRIYCQMDYSSKVDELIYNEKIDTICYDSPYTVSMLDYKKLKTDGIRQVCVFHNVEHKFFRDTHKGNGITKLVWNLETNRIKLLEHTILNAMDSNVFIALSDYLYFKKIEADASLEYIPPLMKQKKRVWELTDSNYILFPGSLLFGPNMSGIKWFYNNVFKEIIKEHNIKLYITGKYSSVIKKEIDSWNNVRLTGFVSDEEMAKLYQECLFTVSPIFDGSGIKMKLLDIMSYGVPVIASEASVEGLEKNDFLPVAKDAVEFQSFVRELLTNSQKRVSLSDKEYEFFYKVYASDNTLKKWVRALS